MTDQPARSGRLTLREEPGGFRHYLDGEPVHAGTVLEVMLPSEGWFAIRFETSDRGRNARFYFGVKGTEDQACVQLPDGAILRWPEAS